MYKKQGGFTLIELLIVVAIVGIISAIAVPNILNALDRGKQKRTMADLRSLATAVESYSVDNTNYPIVTTIGALGTTLEPIYIETTPLEDAWGRRFIVESSAIAYSIGSGGKDGGALTYLGGNGTTQNFNDAIIYANGQFVQWPAGSQN